jgi:hypothetical protein
MIEKEFTREATSIDIPSSNRFKKSEAEVCFTVIINNKTAAAATKGSLTVFDADTGDATGAHHPSVSGESLLTSGSGVWFKASAHF